MTESILLVTGTSSGIGLATSVAAARNGFTVVATIRDLGKADALRSAADAAGVTLDLRKLDVTDPATIESCFAHVRATYGRLDAVLNNAGAGHLGTIEVESVDEVRAVMEVDFFGVVAVSVVEPGAVTTEFVANVGLPETPAAYGTPYEGALRAYLERTAAAFDPANAQTPEGVADAIVAVLTDERPAARVQTSEAARRFAGVKLSDLDGAHMQHVTAGWVAGT